MFLLVSTEVSTEESNEESTEVSENVTPRFVEKPKSKTIDYSSCVPLRKNLARSCSSAYKF